MSGKTKSILRAKRQEVRAPRRHLSTFFKLKYEIIQKRCSQKSFPHDLYIQNVTYFHAFFMYLIFLCCTISGTGPDQRRGGQNPDRQILRRLHFFCDFFQLSKIKKWHQNNKR